MSDLFNQIYGLIKADEVLISEHGYDELAEDNLSIREIVEGVANGTMLKNIPSTPKDHVFWFCSRTGQEILSMLYGVFQKGLINPLFWSLPTGQIRNAGMKIFYGEAKDETSEKNQVYP
ncbi:MAG: hypothetical protein U5L07_13805 [Desulfobacterales bacterium]|nr:hypothetical protein [Desulfobacterales bacterium]